MSAKPDETFNKNDGTATNTASVNIAPLRVDHNSDCAQLFTTWSVGFQKRENVANNFIMASGHFKFRLLN